MIASVSGRRSVTCVPWPGAVATSIAPRSPSMVCLTTSMPTPRPDSADDRRGGGETRVEDELMDLLVARAPRPGAIRPLLLGLGADALGIEAAPIVARR